MRRIAIGLLVVLFATPLLAEEGLVSAADTGHKKIDVVFVLDTTGSMGGMIEGAKQKIWFIANSMATAQPAPLIRMGLVGYRDKGDAYVTKRTELTTDLDKVYTELMGFQAAGGGDTPESVNQALHQAVVSQQWSTGQDVYRVVFLVGDQPPHMDYQDDIKYQQSCKLAKERGVVINTIQCGPAAATKPIWQEIAQLAGGRYFQVQQSGGTVVIKTPYDEQLTRLSQQMDATRLYYGDLRQREEQSVRSGNAKKIYTRGSSTANAQRALFNSSKAGYDNFCGLQELVSEVESGKVKLADIDVKHLPKAMQKMTLEQRAAHLKQKLAERETLRKQIAEVALKRTKHVQQQTAKLGDKVKAGFDAAMIRCIKEQSKRPAKKDAPAKPESKQPKVKVEVKVTTE